MTDISILDSVVLGVVEGLTEFLPVSSTGHLTIAEKMLDLPIDDKGVTAFTAIIQMGAIAAVLVYFFSDIVRIVSAWVARLRQGRGARLVRLPLRLVRHLGQPADRRHRLPGRATSSPGRCAACGWSPIALIAWSAVMVVRRARATQVRKEQQTSR